VKNIVFIILVTAAFGLNGQSSVFPGDVFFDSENQRNFFNDSNALSFHPSVLPVFNAEFVYLKRDNDVSCVNPNDCFSRERNWVGRKLFDEHLIVVDHDEEDGLIKRSFLLEISPLFNFQAGKDLGDTSGEKLYVNSRGVLIKGAVGDKFRFESVFLENQAILPSYQGGFATAYAVIPGNGRWKKFKTNGYDYSMASGYISYKACRFFHLQAGHGKFKIGNGYRSMLLSDNSFTYPYLRFTHNWWKGKIQYTNIYAVLMNLNSGGVTTPPFTERLFQKKASAFHHLSFNFSKYLNLSLFQSLIWQHPDTKNRQNPGLAYFNPLIFSNLAVYGLQSNYNLMAGIDVSIRPVKNVFIYGQYALDELGASTAISNKSAYQAGIKYYDAFTLKNLFVQLEYNSARPFMYTATDVAQSYTHYNQALAHPLGANFTEIVALLAYRYKRIFVQGKINMIEQGLNAGNNYGQDIFTSDFVPALNEQSQNQGILSGTVILDGKLGYLFNPKTNFNISIGGLIRSFTWKASTLANPEPTKYFYISLKTSLYNQYWDF
jgi:hypothetical protein